ncbi:MAG: hypothetical protein AAF329_08140 [Cyanobacteria bacterium P01_A01_bin.17]
MTNPNDPRYTSETEAQRDLDRRLRERDSENTSRGLLIGVLATAVVGLGILAWFLSTQRDSPTVAPVPVPVPDTQASPSPSPVPPDVNVNITEPPVETAPPPEINTEVTVPSPAVQPSPESQPAPVEENPAPEATSSPSPQPTDPPADAGSGEQSPAQPE